MKMKAWSPLLSQKSFSNELPLYVQNENSTHNVEHLEECFEEYFKDQIEIGSSNINILKIIDNFWF